MINLTTKHPKILIFISMIKYLEILIVISLIIKFRTYLISCFIPLFTKLLSYACHAVKKYAPFASRSSDLSLSLRFSGYEHFVTSEIFGAIPFNRWLFNDAFSAVKWQVDE